MFKNTELGTRWCLQNHAKVSGQAWGLQSQRLPVLSTHRGATLGEALRPAQDAQVGREEPVRGGADQGLMRCPLLLGPQSLVGKQALSSSVHSTCSLHVCCLQGPLGLSLNSLSASDRRDQALGNASQFGSVSSVAWSCPTLCNPMNRSMPGLPVHHQLLELRVMFIESVMPSNPLILCRPLILLPSTFPSITVLSSESVLRIRWPKYWSFSFSISPSNEHPGLISFRMDWLDLLAVQGTLKSLLQHHSSKGSILWHSAFFIVQQSHPYMTTGKTIALARRTFVGKVMSLLSNMLLRLVIAFLPRSK